MLKVEFQYKGGKTVIQAIEENKMRQICSKFAQKAQLDNNSLYFMYSGNTVNLDLSIAQLINKTDKERKAMSIIAIDHSNESGNNSIISSPYVICPICKETARFEINKYRIKIYNCKNGHVVDNILLKEFENTQLIDESLIVCDECKKNNKGNTYNKEMYICNKCNKKLCPLCKSSHDKNHIIINYEQKNYICNNHNKEYNSYCETCNKDICLLCKKEHKGHKIILYDEIIQEKLMSKEDLKAFINLIINSINKKMEMIINKINNVKKNIEIYLKILEKNLVNFNINSINYNILQNINYNFEDEEPKLGYLREDLTILLLDKNTKNFLPLLIKLYNQMNINEIDLIYNVPNNSKEIKIFGYDFVEQNKNLCNIIYNNQEYDLSTTFNCENVKDNLLKIKLNGINNITVLNSMFQGCSQLSKLTDLSNLDTNNVIMMESLFKDCKCLELPDISSWNVNNVGSMRSMFQGCSSLKSLPDISKWNMSSVMDTRYMFKGCSSLESLPDISKWDLPALKLNNQKVGGIEDMFYGCPKSLNIPEKFKNIK